MIKRIHQILVQIVEKGYWIFFAAAVVTLALFCFYKLDVKYVDSWDEARHGVNAYEMIENDNYIQHTYNYEVDDWNLKPSMSYWGILLGFGLFGYSVLGLRFYSALCYLVTGVLCSLYVKKHTKVGSILVLGFFCANTLPLYAHLARAGDADSLYQMFFTMAMLAMLEIPGNKKRLYICGLCFSLAFLTKSWHAGMIAAIGGLYLLLTGEIKKLKLKEWGLFLASVLVPLVLWFGWRYTKDGFTFLRQMVEVDLLARTGTDNFEGHSFPFDFYWESVFACKEYIYPWLVGIAGAGVLGWIGNRVLRARKQTVPQASSVSASEVIGLALWFGITFLGFSAMKTKLIWYCYPALIPLFVGAAIFLGRLIEGCKKAEGQEPAEDKGWITQGLAAGRILLAIGGMVLVAHFMNVTYDTAIRYVHGDSFQDFLKISAEQDSPYAGTDAYVQAFGEKAEQVGDWDQNWLFVAEISGNFRCKDGGVEAFLEAGEDAVLYIDRENYVEYEELLEGCETLYLHEGYPYVLVRK